MEIIDGLIFVKLKNTAMVEALTDARARARVCARICQYRGVLKNNTGTLQFNIHLKSDAPEVPQ